MMMMFGIKEHQQSSYHKETDEWVALFHADGARQAKKFQD